MGKYKVDITGINTNELKTLTNAQMQELFKKYKNGDATAKEAIINGNLRLVLSILQRFNKDKYSVDDLFQIGCVGLIKAVDNFNMSYNCLFSTYAVPLITGEIKRYIRDNTSLRISRGIKDNAYKVLKCKEEFLQENNREPTWEEISTILGLSLYEIRGALDSLVTPVSIFEPIYNDGGDTIYLCDKIADTTKLSEDRDYLITLKKALLNLKARERIVLESRYMIGKTQSEIASTLNISQAQVSRIEKNAIHSLQGMIRQ